MLSRRILQDAADLESCCVKIVFLTTYDIGLNFFSHLAKIIESPSSSIDGKAIDIQGTQFISSVSHNTFCPPTVFAYTE